MPLRSSCSSEPAVASGGNLATVRIASAPTLQSGSVALVAIPRALRTGIRLRPRPTVIVCCFQQARRCRLSTDRRTRQRALADCPVCLSIRLDRDDQHPESGERTGAGKNWTRRTTDVWISICGYLLISKSAPSRGHSLRVDQIRVVCWPHPTTFDPRVIESWEHALEKASAGPASYKWAK